MMMTTTTMMPRYAEYALFLHTQAHDGTGCLYLIANALLISNLDPYTLQTIFSCCFKQYFHPVCA